MAFTNRSEVDAITDVAYKKQSFLDFFTNFLLLVVSHNDAQSCVCSKKVSSHVMYCSILSFSNTIKQSTGTTSPF